MSDRDDVLDQEATLQSGPLSACFPDLSHCGTCRSVPAAPLQKQPQKLIDLERSGQHGCEVCALITRGLRVFVEAQEMPVFQALDALMYCHPESEGCGLEISAEGGSERLSLLLVVEQDLATNRDGNHRPLTSSSSRLPLHVPDRLDLPRAAALIKIWWTNCGREHRKCDRQRSTEIPRRVLQIPLVGVSGIRLRDDLGQETPYAALSYCWGSSGADMITTLESEPQHLANIEWEHLPKLFQDTIQLCQALEIGYLWIDRLCILQDSLEDWEIESSKMADIYARACLTIATSASPDPSTGLFETRATRSFSQRRGEKLSFRSSFIPFDHEQRDYRIGPARLSSYHILTSSFPSGLDQDAPLCTRAWAFQERLLSKRVIHFQAAELVWGCGTCMDCECGRINIPLISLDCPDESEVTRTVYSIGILDKLNIRLSEVWENWTQLVGRYSSLALSHQQDRLTALSGLASVLDRKKLLGAYIAGIWTGVLPPGLDWSLWSSEVQTVDSSLAPARIPSWSWASIPMQGKSRICHTRRPRTWKCPFFKVVACDHVLSGENLFGGINSATLTVQARCIRGYIIVDRRELLRRKLFQSMIHHKIGREQRPSSPNTYLISSESGGKSISVSVHGTPDFGEVYPEATEVLLLQLGSGTALVPEAGMNDNISGVSHRRLGTVNIRQSQIDDVEPHFRVEVVDII